MKRKRAERNGYVIPVAGTDFRVLRAAHGLRGRARRRRGRRGQAVRFAGWPFSRRAERFWHGSRAPGALQLSPGPAVSCGSFRRLPGAVRPFRPPASAERLAGAARLLTSRERKTANAMRYMPQNASGRISAIRKLNNCVLVEIKSPGGSFAIFPVV